jgi:hypothetical protein
MLTNDPPLLPSREGILQTLEQVRADLTRKLTTGRFRNPDVEKMRDVKTRLLIYNCQVLAGVLKDADLDDLKHRLEVLEGRKDPRRIGPTTGPSFPRFPDPDPITLSDLIRREK